MKYTSLTHYVNGTNTQSDWYYTNRWEEYCRQNLDIVWSKIYESRSGISVKSYFPDEFEEYREIGQKTL